MFSIKPKSLIILRRKTIETTDVRKDSPPGSFYRSFELRWKLGTAYCNKDLQIFFPKDETVSFDNLVLATCDLLHSFARSYFYQIPLPDISPVEEIRIFLLRIEDIKYYDLGQDPLATPPSQILDKISPYLKPWSVTITKAAINAISSQILRDRFSILDELHCVHVYQRAHDLTEENLEKVAVINPLLFEKFGKKWYFAYFRTKSLLDVIERLKDVENAEISIVRGEADIFVSVLSEDRREILSRIEKVISLLEPRESGNTASGLSFSVIRFFKYCGHLIVENKISELPSGSDIKKLIELTRNWNSRKVTEQEKHELLQKSYILGPRLLYKREFLRNRMIRKTFLLVFVVAVNDDVLRMFENMVINEIKYKPEINTICRIEGSLLFNYFFEFITDCYTVDDNISAIHEEANKLHLELGSRSIVTFKELADHGRMVDNLWSLPRPTEELLFLEEISHLTEKTDDFRNLGRAARGAFIFGQGLKYLDEMEANVHGFVTRSVAVALKELSKAVVFLESESDLERYTQPFIDVTEWVKGLMLEVLLKHEGDNRERWKKLQQQLSLKTSNIKGATFGDMKDIYTKWLENRFPHKELDRTEKNLFDDMNYYRNKLVHKEYEKIKSNEEAEDAFLRLIRFSCRHFKEFLI